MIFFSFSKKYRPFEHLKCHECLWCKFFDDCKEEHERMLRYGAKIKLSSAYGETVNVHPEDEWYCVGTPFSKNRTKRIK